MEIFDWYVDQKVHCKHANLSAMNHDEPTVQHNSTDISSILQKTTHSKLTHFESIKR